MQEDEETHTIGLGSVLIADDEEAQRHFFTRICDDWNVPCHCAATGGECLELAESQPFRMIFVDLYMPGSDLQEVLPRLRELQPDATLIAISVEDHEPTIKRVFALGANAYLTKPLSLPALRELITASA